MASPQAILAASKAARAAKAMPGAARPTPAPQGALDGSWIGQLPQYSLTPGNPYDPPYGPFLPRPSDEFTAGAFAPFSPILPVPVDQPPPGLPRAQPRRWQYPVGWNLPVGQPGTEGYKLTSFATLKSLSDLYSILRRCLQIRKGEIRALDWDIVLTKDAAKRYRGDRKAMRDFGERQARVKKWFRQPDPNYSSFSSWLDACLDQVFVFDALSLYMCPVKGRGLGKGLLGSDLDSLWLIDGSGIRPLAGLHGETPRPPAVAYQQYEYGVPRSDYTMMVDGRDLAEHGIGDDDLKAELRGDQLMYLPYLARTDSPYGFSLVEQCLIPVMTGLQKQAYQLDFFNESSVPRVYISPGDSSMTPNQIRELQLALNAVAGDIGNFFKVTVLPPGSKVIPQKEMQIVDQADEWIANEVAMTCGVKPIELGIIPQVSTVASPFAAREMAQASRSIQERTDTKPTLRFITEIFDTLIQIVCGQDDMRFLFSGMEEQADLASQTDMGVKQIQSGIKSIDEFRDSLGLTPWDLPETRNPVIFTPTGPIPLNPDDSGLPAIAALPGSPMAPPPGPTDPAGKKPSSSSATGAHAAASGGGKAGANSSGRPGSVTERQASRGGALAPFHASSTGAPGTATAGAPHKAAYAELEALTRHLNKGRDIATWQAIHLPGAVMAAISEDLTKGLTPDQVFVMTAPVVGAFLPKAQAAPQPNQQQQAQQARQEQQQLIAQYTKRIRAAFAAAIAAARALIAAWAAGTLTVTAAVLAAMIIAEIRKQLLRALTWTWKAAWKAGAGQDAKALKAALEAFLATVGLTWAELIAGTGEAALLQAIKDALVAGDPEAVADALSRILNVDARPETIATTEVMRAWNAAVLAVMKATGVAYKAWNTRRDGKVCARCRTNAAAGAIPVDQPFPSGDLAPGAHTGCRCWISKAAPPKGAPVGRKAARVLRRQVDTNGQEFWGDAPAMEAGSPAGGGAATGPFPHRADGAPREDIPGSVPGATAGGEPPRWDGSQVEPHVLSLPSGDDGAWGQAAGQGVPRAEGFPAQYMDGYWPEGGHGTGQAGTSSPGGANGRPPNPAGKTARVSAGLEGRPVPARKVYAQLLANFPPSSLKWVLKARWRLADVPMAAIDFADEGKWAAAHQPAHVAQFARELERGAKVDPPVMVDEPGHMHLIVADGRHRTLAHREIGRDTVRAYVGEVNRRGGPWLRIYQRQEHTGSSPRNKSFTAGALGIPGAVHGNVPFNLAGQGQREPYVAGLLVRAQDTGRVLMLQRALDDDQDHAAGRLEPPGGHAEDGESLIRAAMREFAEEVGHPVPTGSLAGSWTSGDGIYRGFVLDVPSEDAIDLENGRDQIENPDGDSFEIALWVDPALLAGNPLVRPEMARDHPQVMAALGGAFKSARTPIVSTVHAPLGHEGLWHTPDKHVPTVQQLPAYHQNTARALMRDGMGEQQAIATAVNAVKEWAAGRAFGGKVKVTPEVQAAAQRADAEWERLKASHH